MATVDTIPALRRRIQSELDLGASMREALQGYREAGGKIRTDDFATLWRDEQRKREKAPA